MRLAASSSDPMSFSALQVYTPRSSNMTLFTVNFPNVDPFLILLTEYFTLLEVSMSVAMIFSDTTPSALVKDHDI